jgi:hypothetical protein
MGTVTQLKVPSPADAPTMTAAELVERIAERGGRVLRMKQPPSVFCLTDDPELADWLFARGATTFTARGLKNNGSYKRARDGKDEWDVWIHPIPVLGEETAWEVAGHAG